MSRRKKYPDTLNPEIKKLYVEEGLSLNKIAQRLEMHPEIVKRRLNKMNIETRNRRNAMINFHKTKE